MDNYSKIKRLLKFHEDRSVFYHVQLISRRESKQLDFSPLVTNQHWLVRGEKQLEDMYPTIQAFCNEFSVRCYISVVPRSIALHTKDLILELTRKQLEGDYSKITSVSRSVASKDTVRLKLPRSEKLIMVDIDGTSSEADIMEVLSHIGWNGSASEMTILNTVRGFHVLVPYLSLFNSRGRNFKLGKEYKINVSAGGEVDFTVIDDCNVLLYCR